MMGEKKILVSADEFTRLRLRCNHCQADSIFALDDSIPIGQAVCSSCTMPMADAHHVVNKYREVFAEMRRFAKGRNATFEIAWREV